MDEKLISKIDQLIEEFEPNLVSDTIKLVNINSEQGEPQPKAPFGLGPKKVLDTVIEMGKSDGFYTTDYDVGVISVAYKNGQPDLGIWAHGDVVPAGDGWSFEPYNATVYKGCIVGRGATDNKGQLSAIYNLLKIFKKLGIDLKYNPALYVGSNEESGIGDIKGVEGNPDAKGFINVCTPPKLSLVPDCSFPISYGAKGGCFVKIKSKKKLQNFTLTAGLYDTPGFATAIFNSTNLPDNLENCTIEKTDKTIITTYTQPRHTTSPDPNGNMITNICSALLDNGLTNPEEAKILEFFKNISLDVTGKTFNLDFESKLMSNVTVYPKSIYNHDGYPEMELRIRYPIDITYNELQQRIANVCEKLGFSVTGNSDVQPFMLDKNSAVVQELTKIANQVTGEEKQPFINGITYAVSLPNAYPFGMAGCLPPEDFKGNQGGAHSVDECVSIARLKRAMRIYARALLKLNEIDW